MSSSDTDRGPSESSKREYLLAQIRQKDAIIESLLKQARIKTTIDRIYADRITASQPLHCYTPIYRGLPYGYQPVRREEGERCWMAGEDAGQRQYVLAFYHEVFGVRSSEGTK